MTMTALVEQRTAAHESLVELLLRILLGLWGWQDTVRDPVLSKGAIAASIYYVELAMQAARQQETAFVVAYAEQMGVPYSGDDLLTEPVYPRDADMVDVYGRFLDEFRWQRYGKAQDAARSALVQDQDDDGPQPSRDLDPVSLDLPDAGD